MNHPDVSSFAEAIANLGLSETETAIAILWFHDHHDRGKVLTAKAIASEMIELGLAKNPNVSRLATNLIKHEATARSKDGVKLGTRCRAGLNAQFLQYVKTPNVVVEDKFLPDTIIQGTRPYLERLARQINGCYQHGFLDGSAVLCRRLVEGLLIESFKVAGHDDKIRDNDGNYLLFEGLVRIAESGQFVRLPRTAPTALKIVKKIGDTAAHHPTHITTGPDIEKLGVEFRQLVSELLALAKIQKSSN